LALESSRGALNIRVSDIEKFDNGFGYVFLEIAVIADKKNRLFFTHQEPNLSR